MTKIKDEIVCDRCGEKITWGVMGYSLSTFGKFLCRSCQKLERQERYPPRLAKYLNKKTDEVTTKKSN